MNPPMWLFPVASWSKYFGFENNKNKKKGLMEMFTKGCSLQSCVTSTGGRLSLSPQIMCRYAQDEPGQPYFQNRSLEGFRDV